MHGVDGAQSECAHAARRAPRLSSSVQSVCAEPKKTAGVRTPPHIPWVCARPRTKARSRALGPAHGVVHRPRFKLLCARALLARRRRRTTRGEQDKKKHGARPRRVASECACGRDPRALVCARRAAALLTGARVQYSAFSVQRPSSEHRESKRYVHVRVPPTVRTRAGDANMSPACRHRCAFPRPLSPVSRSGVASSESDARLCRHPERCARGRRARHAHGVPVGTPSVQWRAQLAPARVRVDRERADGRAERLSSRQSAPGAHATACIRACERAPPQRLETRCTAP